MRSPYSLSHLAATTIRSPGGVPGRVSVRLSRIPVVLISSVERRSIAGDRNPFPGLL